MTDTAKKMAAALAAVNAFLQEEEAIFQQREMSSAKSHAQPRENDVWSLSGRQDMMSLRQLIQMKAFSRF